MNSLISQIGSVALVALLAFVLYRRVRGNFGQQPLRPARMIVRGAILFLIGCFLLPLAIRSGTSLYALIAALAAGILLALWGAQRTGFTRTPEQLYYVPHAYTGIAVSALFLGRLLYRLVQVYSGGASVHAAVGRDQVLTPASMASSPMTLGLFFVLMAYYVCYYSLVLWKSKRFAPKVRRP